MQPVEGGCHLAIPQQRGVYMLEAGQQADAGAGRQVCQQRLSLTAAQA